MFLRTSVLAMRKIADVKDHLRNLRTDDKGVTSLEYGVVAAIMVVAIGIAFNTLGGKLEDLMTAIGATLKIT